VHHPDSQYFLSEFPTRLTVALLTLLITLPLPGQEPSSSPPALSERAQRAFDKMVIPEGMVKKIFAVEPMVQDPVAFCFDDQGRVFVAESFRQENGVEDNRSSAFWLLDDLASQSNDDRLAMYEKWKDQRLGGMEYYSRHEDRVQLLTDEDGDGTADRVGTFAGPFNEPLDGTAAGLIARAGDVYLTNIPHLWLLRDEDDDGVADVKRSLQDGFGVRIALRGHDMHGLVWGPDGRLYWSIGDRGYHFETSDGVLMHSPGSGAVFRCEPDGSDIEIYCHGLRNPQELAFDERGNLFTGDNNSDAGDKARIVYCVEGGETGWQMEFQTLEGENRRGSWNQEGIWWLRHDDQPAWTLPPVDHLTSGPSGFVFYPGTGLSEKYDSRFFLCDFRGAIDTSKVWTFRLEEEGAGFRLEEAEVFLDRILATDVDFGPDGRFYVSDWGGGWGSNHTGGIFTVEDPARRGSPQVAEVARLIGEGFGDRSSIQLTTLLAHPDQRIRQRAQFTLAGRRDGTSHLFDGLGRFEETIPRLHCVWGLAQWARVFPDLPASDIVLRKFRQLLTDDDSEVRAQTCRMLGDLRAGDALADLVAALEDQAPRVRFFAAIALGRLGNGEALAPLIDLARKNDDDDAYLRHAAVMGLAGCATADELLPWSQDRDRAVRLAVLLALRRHAHPSLAIFLDDPDSRLVTEAARAIHDLPVLEAMPALASLAERITDDREAMPADAVAGSKEEGEPAPLPLLRRVISSNLWLGRVDGPSRLVAMAMAEELPMRARKLALEALVAWRQPGPREMVNGFYRPVENPERDEARMRRQISPGLQALVASSGSPLAGTAQRLASDLKIPLDPAVNRAILSDTSQPDIYRIEALDQICRQGEKEADEARAMALSSDRPALRIASLERLADSSAGVQALTSRAKSGPFEERQYALAALSRRAHANHVAAIALDSWLGLLEKDAVETGLQLDVYLACIGSGSLELSERALRWWRAVPIEDRMRRYHFALAGGDPQAGRRVFIEHPVAQCNRCHLIEGGGGVSGPDLRGLSSRRSPEEILTSIMYPSLQISEGYGELGEVSAMPEAHFALENREIRDLMSFLNGL